eukprot:tig00001003_g6291.t1
MSSAATQMQVRKPKNQRAKRALERRAPKLVENPKHSLVLKGKHTSGTITQVLTDLHLLKKPHSIKFSRHNEILPFENHASLEFFAQKNDCSLFALGTHSKKRPHNLVIGRMFDFHLLDMVELGVENFKSMQEFKASKSVLGSKPCMAFIGEDWDRTTNSAKLRSILLDFFRGQEVSLINLAGLDHVLVFSLAAEKVYVRHYRILLKKSGTKLPRVELEEIGPSMEITSRRTHFASEDLFKAACRQPKAVKPKKIKNISRSETEGRLGRIHMNKQDFGKLQTRKIKGLKRSRSANGAEGDDTAQEGKRIKADIETDGR